jgi:hypothetical protein
MKKSDFLFCALPLLLAFAAQAQDRKAAVYPAMAPIAQYRISGRDDEIALARSAAPPSISVDADVLVLGDRGYVTAVKGKNGFICFVERSWDAGFDDPQFWNRNFADRTVSTLRPHARSCRNSSSPPSGCCQA